MSGGRTAMTQSHSIHGGALSFMSCTSGRESSPLDENDSHQNGEFKTETKKKRFHPLRNLRRMFRRKNRHSNVPNDSYNIGSTESTEINTTPLEQRSCSTSKLAEENGIQNLMKSNRLAPGLSLSHDSVFTPDRADSGLSSSDLENSSLSISNFVPPPMECPLKSHSSCSESSLLSMDSSEAELSPTAVKSDLDLGITSYKLSHSAAKHKMAVKPKRNHGAPRSRRRAVSSKSPLPSTPEVNEEAPGVKGFSSNTTDFFPENPESSISSKPSSPLDEKSNELKPKLTSKSYESDFVVTPKVRSKLTTEYKAEESINHSEKEVEDPLKCKKNTDECGDVNEEDWGDREEEFTSRKEESFFGRLLSRRSDKKKKNKIACDEEQSGEETVRNSSPAKETKNSAGNRNVNRRQRVEPIEIPSSPSLLKKTECESAGRNGRDSCNRMKISYSMSPPRTVFPNSNLSRSSSPPKVVWPEHFSYYKNTSQKEKNEMGESIIKVEGRTSIDEDAIRKIRRDLSPTVSKTKETQKIIADEVESKFKMLMLGEERGGKTKQSREEDAFKSKIVGPDLDKPQGSFKRESEKFKTSKVIAKSNSIDSPDRLDVGVSEVPASLKTTSEVFPSTDVLITHEEPHYVNLKNILPVLSNYEKVHHGYENVQVIELVKKEKDGKSLLGDKPTEKPQKLRESDDTAESPVEKKTPKFERPKSLRTDAIDGTPEFMKVQLNKVELREEKTDLSPTGVKSTLIERRKSELMLTTETDEKEWKSKAKVLKKQTSFSENAASKKQTEESQTTAPNEKTEVAEVVSEVVMRKKPNATGKGGDDQPELMKVFARRSLKVRESEEMAEEMRRSRDSDKENENTESPKEERKKIIKQESEEKKQKEVEKMENETSRGREEVIIQVTPLKPEIIGKKSVFQKYGKGTPEKAKTTGQENGAVTKTRKEQAILEESKSNKMKEMKTDLVTVSCIKEAKSEEESEETGFKRIQQRKAEWERRVQQAAK